MNIVHGWNGTHHGWSWVDGERMGPMKPTREAAAEDWAKWNAIEVARQEVQEREALKCAATTSHVVAGELGCQSC